MALGMNDQPSATFRLDKYDSLSMLAVTPFMPSFVRWVEALMLAKCRRNVRGEFELLEHD